MSETWTRVAARSDLDQGLTLVRVAGESIVAGMIGERLFAFSAFCPHMNGPMVRSEIEKYVVSCPLHGWRFDLAEGGRELHGYRGLRMFPVKILDEDVMVQLAGERVCGCTGSEAHGSQD